MAQRHRWFAAVYDWTTAIAERHGRERQREYLWRNVGGKVLEVGLGTGVNLPHYPGGTSVVGIEPDPYMLRRARQRRDQLGVPVALLQGRAEALPFCDASFDAVVSTLVFCYVRDVPAGLQEVRRVLKPNGAFYFLEHTQIQGRSRTPVRNLIAPLWRWVAAGCDMNWDPITAIHAAGFEIVELEEFCVGISPTRRHVRGVARI